LRKPWNEVRTFSKFKILELKTRCTSASYKRVVSLTISFRSLRKCPICWDSKIICRKRTKPDVGRHRVLRCLILSQIGSKSGKLKTWIFLIQFHHLQKKRIMLNIKRFIHCSFCDFQQSPYLIGWLLFVEHSG
jgi:hypothetical protein